MRADAQGKVIGACRADVVGRAMMQGLNTEDAGRAMQGRGDKSCAMRDEAIAPARDYCQLPERLACQ
jgi:hypothetical protein